MTKHSPHLNKYVELFNKEMAEVDPLQQVVLKGHLIIESAIDNILSIIFFHPEHIFRTARLGFAQKVAVARAAGLRKDKNSMWTLIMSVNEVRNEVAHNLAGEKRTAKMAQLRRLFLTEATDEFRKEFAKNGIDLDMADDTIIVLYSCSLCTGFLGTYEDDVKYLRRLIDTFDVIANPDQVRVTVKSANEAKRKKK
jgi:hypothetical protein